MNNVDKCILKLKIFMLDLIKYNPNVNFTIHEVNYILKDKTIFFNLGTSPSDCIRAEIFCLELGPLFEWTLVDRDGTKAHSTGYASFLHTLQTTCEWCDSISSPFMDKYILSVQFVIYYETDDGEHLVICADKKALENWIDNLTKSDVPFLTIVNAFTNLLVILKNDKL